MPDPRNPYSYPQQQPISRQSPSTMPDPRNPYSYPQPPISRQPHSTMPDPRNPYTYPQQPISRQPPSTTYQKPAVQLVYGGYRCCKCGTDYPTNNTNEYCNGCKKHYHCNACNQHYLQ